MLLRGIFYIIIQAGFIYCVYRRKKAAEERAQIMHEQIMNETPPLYPCAPRSDAEHGISLEIERSQFCPRCNTCLRGDAQFCSNCGLPVPQAP